MSFMPSKTKKDALRRLSELLGLRFNLSEGSTIPSGLFSAATHRCGVEDTGSMPVRGERIVRHAGLTWDGKCDSRGAPSGGGSTVTLTGLNRMLEALLVLGVRPTRAEYPDVVDGIGIPYGTVHQSIETHLDATPASARVASPSPTVETQLREILADYVRSTGVEPRSPKTSEPSYDVAWEYNESVVLAVVKDAGDTDHRQQVRLGVGELLEHAAVLNDEVPGDYRTVLLLDQSPSEFDYLLSTSSGVVIMGPTQLSELGLEDLLPLRP